MKGRAAVQLVAWAGLCLVGFWLQPFVGFGLSVAVMSYYSWEGSRQQVANSVQEQLMKLELGVMAKLAENKEHVTKLVDAFNAIRTDEAVRRGQPGSVPRLRG